MINRDVMKPVFVVLYILTISGLFLTSSNAEMSFDLESDDSLFIMKIGQIISVIMIFILPALLYSYFFTSEKFKFFNLHISPKWISYAITALIMVAVLPAINVLAEFNQSIELPSAFSSIELWMKTSEENAKKITEAFLKMESISDLILNIIVIALFAALSEEVFFRGVVQKVLIKFTKNPHLGIWISAVLFSAMHGQYYGFIPRMMLGGVLGYMFFWSGSLWLPIIGHFINNGAAVVVSYLIQRTIISEDIETLGTGNMAWLYFFVSISLTATLLFFLKKINEKNSKFN